ncbi:MAG: YkgJ family cysteine cluster protein [Salinarchaeum sp.]
MRRVTVYPDKEAIVTFDPSITFRCVEECTWCCHHGVLLYGPDFKELAAHADLSESTTSFRGERFVRREPADHDHIAEDGQACHFLREDGRCALHAEVDWKPTRCSVFPLHVEPDGDALRVSIRDEANEHCEGLDVGEHRLIDHLADFLPPVLWELPRPETDRVIG